MKNIGVSVAAPEQHIPDKNCPFTGDLHVRGRMHVGKVISDKMTKTATIEFQRKRLNKKYERYQRIRTRIHAHNPPSLQAKEGDTVKIMETRPLSKTKHFVIIEIIKRA